MSGIARGDGTNNILVYAVPLTEEFDLDVTNNVINNRNIIGEKYIPGSKEGMYMITEAAFTPQTKETTLIINKLLKHEENGKLKTILWLDHL